MQRWLAIAALGVALLSTPVHGQRGGRGGAPTGGGARGGFVSQGAVATNRRVIVNPVPIGGGFRGPGYGHRYPYRPYYPARIFWGWGYPWNYGYGLYSYPGWGLSDTVAYDSYSPAPTPPPYENAYSDNSIAYLQNSQIQQDEINRLSQEVDRLQDEQRESRDARRAAPQQEPVATVLVFKDHHTEEIKNYAVVGNTLWVFSELRARKIPVANLDVSATIKANDDRDIDFSLPR